MNLAKFLVSVIGAAFNFYFLAHRPRAMYAVIAALLTLRAALYGVRIYRSLP